MATIASPADAKLLEAAYHWKRVAVESVDLISNWREASRKQAPFRWPKDDPDLGPNTRLLAAALQAKGIDPTPIVELHQAVAAWRWARSADGLPEPGALALLLHKAVDLLRPLETEALVRAGSLPAAALPAGPPHGAEGRPAWQPQDAFLEVRELAGKMSGGQRRLVEVILDRGRVPIADVGMLADVKDANRTKAHANAKLFDIGWEIGQHDNHWYLRRV